VKLTKEEVVTIEVLRLKGETNQAIAARLGITEGTVRYHLRRQAQQASDGRAKISLVESLQLVEVVDHWHADQLESLPQGRSPNLKTLWTLLVDEYAYPGSYKSVRSFVRHRFPAAPKRPFRRIETPPAAQVQSDWLETTLRLVGDDGTVQLVTLYGFVMTLSHSRKTAIVWSQRMDQLAWHHVHNEAFKRLGGIAAVNRIDNLKTGVASGCGVWGKVNESYAAYAATMGFHVDPHEARQPQQKGKVERRVGAFKKLDISRVFGSLEELQTYTDESLQRDSVCRKCPVTGESVHATWLMERELLRPLPATMPMPFDLIKQADVHKDCTVRFEGRTYSVPYRFAGAKIEVRGCSGIVQMVDPKTGHVVKRYPRHTGKLLLIDQDCYELEQPDGLEPHVPRPLPLGKMARRIEEIASQGVAVRSIDFYAKIAAGKSSPPEPAT
jgi:transposase